jgi:hypothetical protein
VPIHWHTTIFKLEHSVSLLISLLLDSQPNVSLITIYIYIYVQFISVNFWEYLVCSCVLNSVYKFNFWAVSPHLLVRIYTVHVLQLLSRWTDFGPLLLILHNKCGNWIYCWPILNISNEYLNAHLNRLAYIRGPKCYPRRIKYFRWHYNLMKLIFYSAYIVYMHCITVARTTMNCRCRFIKIYCSYTWNVPVTVAERSKAWTVFARADAGTVGSNPPQGMDV